MADLSSAVKSFESRFSEVVQPLKVDEDPSLPLVCSGGKAEVKGILPALYSSEDLAVREWIKEADRTLELNLGSHHDKHPLGGLAWSHHVLEWVYRPELLEFQMTMADRNGGQRLVTNRYAVKSQMRVK